MFSFSAFGHHEVSFFVDPYYNGEFLFVSAKTSSFECPMSIGKQRQEMMDEICENG